MEDKIHKHIGLTFDDVLLAPQYSEVLSHEIDITSRLTRNITLDIPILSAAMDTVTGAVMAVAMSRHGGFGVVHRNTSPVDQADEVRRVKRAESEMITSPISLTPHHNLKDARHVMRTYNISGVPIVESNSSRQLVGIITSRDLRFENDFNVSIASRMRQGNELIKARYGISSEDAQQLLGKHKIEKLPIVDDEGNLYGLITMKDILRKYEYPHASKDGEGRLRVGAAIGTGEEGLERTELLERAGVDVLVLDTAHGHSKRVLETLREVKNQYSSLEVIVGNVATPRAAVALADAGADAIKIGIGPGSICTTRVVSGVGVPQVTAILEIKKALEHDDVPLIADGGMKYSGDITKAIAAGADTVMLGSVFAGADESPGEKVIYEGRAYKMYRGMGSDAAIAERSGANRYGQEHLDKPIPEGVEGRVPYKGALGDILDQLSGGLRVGMAYCGTPSIQDLQRRGKFIRITQASLIESHPHDVMITKESKNYSR